VRAALLSGCRHGELSRLKPGDYNPDSETLFIQFTKPGKSRHVALPTEGAAFFRQFCGSRVQR
jgi:integrase